MKKIPVGATIAHAYRFAFGHAPAVVKAVWLPLLAQLVLIFLFTKRAALFLAAAQAQDPSAVSLLGPLLLLFPLLMIFFFAQFTAAMETALGRPPQSWVAFHFGKPMWRLLGGFLAALSAITVIAAIAFIAVTLLAVGFNLVAKAVPAPVATFLVGLLSGIFFCVLVFALVRFLFLLAPVNVSEQRFGVGRAWQLSAGNFWRALLVTLAILIPVLIVNYAYTFAITAVPPPPANTSKAAMQAWETAWQVAQLNALASRWYLTLPLTGLLMLFQFGAGCAAQAFAYRALTENEASAPVSGDRLPN